MVCLQKLIILFLPAKHDLNNSVSLNAFASKAATSIVIVEHSSNDLETVIDHTFTASISPFLVLQKLIKAFLFFLVTVGEGSSHLD